MFTFAMGRVVHHRGTEKDKRNTRVYGELRNYIHRRDAETLRTLKSKPEGAEEAEGAEIPAGAMRAWRKSKRDWRGRTRAVFLLWFARRTAREYLPRRR